LYYKMLTYKFLNENTDDGFDNNINESKGNSNKVSKFNNDDDDDNQ
jgi:agmatinase